MSYCHLFFGPTALRYTFGEPSEGAHTITDNMRTKLDAPAYTPTSVSAISAPSSLGVGASGVASITNSGGYTIDWTITNGIINSGQASSSINFTASADPVTLRMTATNSNGCAISDTKSVTVTASAVGAATNVVA